MKRMAKYKNPFLFALSLLPIAAIAGIFVGLYQLDVYPEELLAQLIAEVGSTQVVVVVVAVQTVGYALFCGFFGYILAEKLGLWKPIRLEKTAVLITLAVSLVGGTLFSLDHWVFGSSIPVIQSGNIESLTVNGILASILYGGIIEELMMRLFFMSLLAFLVWKVFCRKYDREHIPTAVFVIANIIAAVAFAAGHLPATAVLFGELTPLLLFRCFLLNGGFGLIFGHLYRKYGIAYAMIGHAMFHIISKLIWIVFI